MRGNRLYGIVILAVATSLVLFGCTPPPDETQESTEMEESMEPPMEASPPGPGPIIDIIEGGGGGGGGTIVYRYNKTDLNVGTPTTDKLDPKYFKKALAVFLADAQNVNGLGKKEYWKLDGKLKIESSSGRVEVVRNAATQNLEWTCYDASDNPTTLVAGGDGDVPGCMLLTGATISGEAGPQTFKGDVVLIGVEGP